MERSLRWRWLQQAPEGILARGRSGARLGVLSGAFNPPTRAHLSLAQAALEQFALEEVVFVLPEQQPHKPRLEPGVATRARLLMAAVDAHPRFSAGLCSHALLLEIHEALRQAYPPHTRFFFLVGCDAAERILRWPYPNREQALAEMFERFELIVAERPGASPMLTEPPGHCYADRIHVLRLPPRWQAVSSTLVRNRIAHGQPVEDLVPPAVAALIEAQQLYRPTPCRSGRQPADDPLHPNP